MTWWKTRWTNCQWAAAIFKYPFDHFIFSQKIGEPQFPYLSPQVNSHSNLKHHWPSQALLPLNGNLEEDENHWSQFHIITFGAADEKKDKAFLILGYRHRDGLTAPTLSCVPCCVVPWYIIYPSCLSWRHLFVVCRMCCIAPIFHQATNQHHPRLEMEALFILCRLFACIAHLGTVSSCLAMNAKQASKSRDKPGIKALWIWIDGSQTREKDHRWTCGYIEAKTTLRLLSYMV